MRLNATVCRPIGSSLSCRQRAATSQPAGQPTHTVDPAAPATGTADKPKTQLSTSIQSVLQKLRSLGKPVQKPVSAKPATDPLALGTVADNTESAEVTPADGDPAASPSNGETGDPNATPATPLSTNLAASDPGGPTPPTGVVAPALEAVRPVTNALATVAGVALTVPGVFAALPGSAASLGDVITSLHR